MIHICYAVLQKMDLEACLEQVFASVADAELGRYSAYIYISRVEQFEDLAERLAGAVHALESGILLDSLVASLVKDEFLYGVRLELFMNLSTMCAGYAVRWPDAALLLE